MEKCPFCGKSISDKISSKNNVKCINKNPMKKCPFCAEQIRKEATICKYCGLDINNKFTFSLLQKRLIFAFIRNIALLLFALLAILYVIGFFFGYFESF